MSQLEQSHRHEPTATSLLQRPECCLAALADAIQDEIAFITQDLDGSVMYLSRSAERVLNHNPAGLIHRPFADSMTDNPCNDHFRVFPSFRGSPVGRICEIFDREGRRVQLTYWRVPIFHQGEPIGTSGILRRLNNNVVESDDLNVSEEKELMERVNSLSNVERQVIELVVDGHMNKKMASILDVAVRTIESRRARAMIKLHARSLSELVQIWVHVRRIEAKIRATQISAPTETMVRVASAGAPRVNTSALASLQDFLHN